jgi:hypothetical protein
LHVMELDVKGGTKRILRTKISSLVWSVGYKRTLLNTNASVEEMEG